MNKGDLIKAVADKAQFRDEDAKTFINALFEVIEEALVSGDKVTITGFGTFEVRERQARKGVNPKTGEEIQIPSSKAPCFKAGKALKDAVQ